MGIRLRIVVWLGVMISAVPCRAAETTAGTSALDEARDLFMQGYYRAAVEKYEPMLQDDATRLAATLGLVECFEQQGKYTEALDRLNEVESLGAESADWHTAVGKFRRHIGAYPEAVQAFRTALRIDGGHPAARVGLGDVYEILGDKEHAIEAYAWFDGRLDDRLMQEAETLTLVARGLYRFSVLSRHPNLVRRTNYILHELLQPAYEKFDRTYWPARLASGELLLSKYNLQQAKADFDAARALNSNLADAYVGLGNIALVGWDFDEAEKRVTSALEINPNHVAARQLLIETRMTERRYADAAKEADRALEINPNDLFTLSLAAAARIRSGDSQGAKEFTDRVAAINPRCGLVHFVIAEWLTAARQFPEAERHYRKAIEADPEDARPRSELGLMYMQWGREEQARVALDEAWTLDPFNKQTYNTLELLDSLETFDRYHTAHFTVHYDAEKDAVLAPYFGDYLESIYEEVCGDFGIELEETTIIEVFPDHAQFGVRITGKPWIHTIGASTGRVIAMDAPRKGASGKPFNWERVLRHEFTHTVTLAATRNRIPHWFTEGLAVLQEDAPRSYRWQRMLARRVRADQLFTLTTIDWGFIRPRRRDDREVAYAQSEWMCEYLIEKYGYGILNRMIAAFRDGRNQEQVFTETVGTSPEEFSEAFKPWATAQVRSWRLRADPVESPLKLKALLLFKSRDAALHGRLARALVAEGEFEAAHAAASRAIELDENNIDAMEVLARFLMARADRAEPGQREEAYAELEPLLERLAAADRNNPTPAEMLGKIALQRDDHDVAVRWFERLKRLRPANPAAYQGLAGIYLQRNEPKKALPALIELWRTDENDASLPLQIAGIFERQPGREADAMLWYRRALAIDPYAIDPHVARAKLAEKTARWDVAIREHRALCHLEPSEAKHFAALARAYANAGHDEKARTAAHQAVKLDPDSPAAEMLPDSNKTPAPNP